jgi:NAD+ kinase
MSAHARPDRVAVVVHPSRPVTSPLETLLRWAQENGIEVVQLTAPASAPPDVAPPSEARPGDLVVAIGGDGTVLSALRAAVPVGAPVLGVACGSVGLLAAVTDAALDSALPHVLTGDWTEHRLPALSIELPNGRCEWAVNDFVAVRHGPGQLVASVSIDNELYVRTAGDGVIVATALGSSAYSMAAGGPLLTYGTAAFVCTPLAMHGGSAPPLVVPATSALHLRLQPGFSSFEIEIDGHDYPSSEVEYTLRLTPDKATLVGLGPPSLGLTALRERRLVTDSARVLARDARGAGDTGSS